MPEPYQREVAVFEAALQLAPEQRASYLEQSCADDPALGERVRSLLKAHERQTDFMASAAKRTLTVAAPLSEKPGDRIGPYKLLQLIGEGGCGLVYMAEQEQPIRRRVALKIIKLGMDTKQVIARFEAERQALALMDHPNIAKVHDAGATASGRPYFVMELVRGIKITDYCDQKKLTTQQRLELFIQVCQAVQHAHQKGIIHRDLKPSNILVAVNDGRTAVKVIDFGIAKATTGERLTDKTLFTAFEQFIGTPAYMSPEQAEITNIDIDTRSDIYSLGVLLYELLTGQTPFDAKELVKAGLDEMRRTLREEEPARPSTRLSTLAANELTTAANRRGLDAPKLVNALRGDLDWIVMKCLEKDRARRYETANGLAVDLQRHLTHQAVVARPPTNLYRLQKVVRRNSLAFSAAGAVGAVLIGGVLVSTLEAVRARRAEREQSQLRQQAQTAQANESRERSKAEHAASQEAEQRARAQALAEANRVNLYAARIKLAEQTFREGNVPRVLELLDSLRPQEGQEDLRSFDWYYLWQLCRSERLVLPGNSDRIRCTAYSPDGRLLGLTDDSGIIRLCDAATGTERARLQGHQGSVSTIAFSPDGKTIASAGVDATVRLWDTAAGTELRTLRVGTNSLLRVAFSPDGTRLAAGEGEINTLWGNPGTTYFPYGSGGGVYVWDTSNFQLEQSFQGQSSGILSLAFSPEGRRLAFSSGRGSPLVRLCDLSARRELAAQTNFSGFVVGLTFAPNGQELLAAVWLPWNDSAEIRALDPLTLGRKRIIVPDAGRVLCLALSPDGKKIAAAGADRSARLWDYQSGDELAAYRGHGREIFSLAFAPDGRELATAGWDKTVRLWNLETSPARQRIDTSQNYSVGFSPDGRWLVSAGMGAELREASSGKIVRTLTDFTNEGDGYIVFSPDGSRLAAGGVAGALQLWDTHSWRHWLVAQDSGLPATRDDKVGVRDNLIAFSPDSRILIESGFGKTIRFWNAADGGLIGVITNRIEACAVACAPDGASVLIGANYHGHLSLWDTATEHFRSPIPGCGPVLRVSRDGHWLASSSSDSPNPSIIVRDLSTRRVHARLVGHQGGIYSAAFSHDNRLLATASWDGTVKIWQVASGQELLSIPSMGGVVWTVAFAPDDKTLAFGSGSARKGSGAVTLLRAASAADTIHTRKVAGRSPPDRTSLQKVIQDRPAGSPKNLVDLSAFFNNFLPNAWSDHKDLVFPKPGIVTLEGVPFDLRGVITLGCDNEKVALKFPANVAGIPVALRCQALHFLQAAFYEEEEGIEIGEYAIHFANGLQVRVPLVYGENISNWCTDPDEPVALGAESAAVWRGQDATTKSFGGEARLYDFRWQNPHPELEIESVDFQSKLTASAPILLAITAAR